MKRLMWVGFGVAVAVSGGALSGVASADNVSISNGAIETSSAAITAPCNAAPLTVASVRTTFTAANGYWLSEVPATGTVAACQTKPYQLTVANNTSFAQLAQWSGTTGGAAAWTATAPAQTDGVDVDAGVPANLRVRVYLVVRTS